MSANVERLRTGHRDLCRPAVDIPISISELESAADEIDRLCEQLAIAERALEEIRAEAYAIGLCTRMYDCAVAALSEIRQRKAVE